MRPTKMPGTTRMRILRARSRRKPVENEKGLQAECLAGLFADLCLKLAAAATRHELDQAAEEAEAEAIDVQGAAGGSRIAAHFRQYVGREIDPEFAAGRCVVTHCSETP